MEKFTSLDQLVNAGMPPHQLDAIKNGQAAMFQGHTYTAEDLGISGTNGLESAVVSAQEAAALKAKIAELEAQLAKGSKKEEEPEFTEAELSGDATEDELDDRSLKDLKALAAVRGIKVEGNKKAVVSALAKKEGE